MSKTVVTSNAKPGKYDHMKPHFTYCLLCGRLTTWRMEICDACGKGANIYQVKRLLEGAEASERGACSEAMHCYEEWHGLDPARPVRLSAGPAVLSQKVAGIYRAHGARGARNLHEREALGMRRCVLMAWAWVAFWRRVEGEL